MAAGQQLMPDQNWDFFWHRYEAGYATDAARAPQADREAAGNLVKTPTSAGT